jgi:protein O-mannosyl-transferase
VESPAPNALWRIRAILCAVTLAAYANSFGLGFALDGRRMALEDPRVRAATSENLSLIASQHYWWPSLVDRLYRPVTTASFLLNYAVFGNGESGTGYHVLNFLLHALNVLLVFELARAVLKRAVPAAFAAALWAVHPVGTEAVSNVAGRADLLSTAAVLGGLLLYIRLATDAKSRTALYAGAIFALSAIGVFSKESSAVLIGLMLLWDIAFGGGLKEGLKRRLPAYGAVAAALLWMWLARQSVLGSGAWPAEPFLDNPLRAAGFAAARLTALKVIGLYLGLLVCPWTLNFDYSYNQVPVSGAGDPAVWVSILAIAAILTAATVRRKTAPELFWAAGFFGIAILPTANLVVTIGSIMALRFLYLPSAAFAIAVAALAFRWKDQKAARIGLAVAIALLGARTVARNPAWADDGALAAADIANGSRSHRPYRLAGEFAYRQDGQGNLDRAIGEMEKAWEITSPLPPAQGDQQIPADLGLMYKLKGDRTGGAGTNAGRAWYEKSIAVLVRGRAILEAHAEAFDRAQVEHRRPAVPHGGNESLLMYLGRSYSALGRWPEAVEALRKGREIKPTDKAFFDELAAAYAAQGKLEGAAIVMVEKAYAFGMSAQTAASLRNLYSRIPDGACAVTGEGGDLRLNGGCPRVRQHMCSGWADLNRLFERALVPARAQTARNDALRFGCGAELFEPGAALPML